jgi:hypothetical protein
MRASKAFYLTYVLFYILLWLKFPEVYRSLADHNLGLVNLALLIVFFVAVYKMIRWRRPAADVVKGMVAESPFTPEIDQNIEIQGKEQALIKEQAKKMTKIEIRTIDDIAQALTEIQRIIEEHRNNLPREERERLALILQEISKKENVLMQGLNKSQKVLQRIGTMDQEQLKDLKERIAKVSGKEKQILKAEIEREEEKLRIEKVAFELEGKVQQFITSFNKLVRSAFEHISRSAHPFDAKPYLVKAKLTVEEIVQILTQMKALETKLIGLTKTQKKLLKKERKTS